MLFTCPGLLLLLPYLNQEAQAFQGAIEVCQIEWFGEIDVRAGFKCRFFHAVNVKSRNGDDWRAVLVAFELAEAFYGFQTVKNRHVQVDNKQTRTMASRQIKRLLAVFSLKNTIAFQFKRALEHNAGVVRIFGNEYCRIKYC